MWGIRSAAGLLLSVSELGSLRGEVGEVGDIGTPPSVMCCCPLETGNCCFNWAWDGFRSSGLRP